IVDIVGYYQAAPSGGVVNNDDRYYTKPEVDAAVATKQTKLTGPQTVVFAPSGFRPETSGIGYSSGLEYLTAFAGGGCFSTGITLPNGATVTRLAGLVFDNDGSAEANVALAYTPASVSARVPMASFGSGVSTVPGTTTVGTNTVTNAVINNATRGYSLEFCGGSSMISLNSVSVTYTLP
ncbi:MAG: hypothetical protein JWL72_2354, partial [Ilumatobacteraceae bacterium]|nr:hypothetical protein [Ilumatobacteraceae bacterium]